MKYKYKQTQMKHEFPVPAVNMYSIYSKSGCIYCRKAKELLKEKGIKFDEIDCDEYLIEPDIKEEFKQFMYSFCFFVSVDKKRQWGGTFPIIFNNEQKFIGGFKELEVYLIEN